MSISRELSKFIEPGGSLSYDNTTSGLSATTIKSAIDELNTLLGGGNIGSQASFDVYDFTSTAAQTTFSLSSNHGKGSNIVAPDLSEGTEYIITDLGDTDFTLIGASSNTVGVTFTKTATAGLGTGTAKVVADYIPGYIKVYLNGVFLSETDYVASDGDNIVLDTGADVGALLSVVVLDSFNIATQLRVLGVDAGAPDNSLVVNSSGNVGIGTLVPSQILNLESATNPAILITDTTNTTSLLLRSQNNTSSVGTSSDHPLVFETNATERMRIDSSGLNVTGDIVLGDNNPTITMNDSSVVDLQHLIVSSSNNLIIAADNNNVDAGTKIELYVDGTERMNVTATGIDVTGSVTANYLTTDDDVSGTITLGRYSSGVVYSLVRPSATATGIEIRTNAGNALAHFLNDGTTVLHHNGSAKLTTLSSGIDVTGSVTADGLTVDGDIAVNDTTPSLTLSDTGGTNQKFVVSHNGATSYLTFRNDTNYGALQFLADNGTTTALRQSISSNGDINLGYEATGTTPKLFWDASAEFLGIGTDSPAAKLHIENGDMRIEKDTKATIGFRGHTTGSTALAFRDSNAGIDRMTIDASGNVGIGTSDLKGSRVQAAGAAASVSPTLGSATDTSLLLTNSDVTYGMNFGVINSGNGWIQQHSNTGTATAYNLLLQPVGGNVGIGVSASLQGELNVGGALSGDPSMYVFGSRGAADNLPAGHLTFRNVANGVGDVNLSRIQSLTGTGSNQTQKGQLAFSTNDGSSLVERMRIDASGKVGIGTASPPSTLTVLGTNDAAGGITLTSTETDTSDKIGRIKTAHYTNAEEPFTFVQTRSYVSDSIINLGGSSGVENAATRIGFWTAVDNTTLTGTEVMRVNSAQNVGIGETSSMFADYKLQVRDDNNGDSNPLLISNKDFSVGTTQSVAINFGLSRDSGVHKPQAGRIRVGREGNTWDADDANIDSYMDFGVYENNALSTKMTISSGGNVGIGTDSANIFSTGGTTNVLGVKSTTGGLISIAATGTNFSGVDLGTDAIRRGGVYSLDGSHLAFYTNSTNSGTSLTERMRIDASGNILFGSNGQGYIDGNNTNTYNSGYNQDDDSWATWMNYNGYQGGTTRYRDFIVGDGKNGRIATFDGSTGSLLVNENGVSGNAEIFRITSGDTSSATAAALFNDSAGTELFLVRSDGAFRTGSGAVSPYNNTAAVTANCFINTDGTLLRATSSRRYKKDISDARFGLSDLLNLRPVNYKGINSEVDKDTIYAGLIAEEVHDAGLTEFVEYNEENQPDALRYQHMVSLCIKAIQEQQEQIEQLKADIAALKS